ncbi:MAG: arsenate reductase ArsC [Candidatus Cloacimonetes bacterium]|nr:arsenate reductase ArsC [Candidatus Cloacimonadota bacterium]
MDCFSAGTEESSVKPEAIFVLKELGIDIKHHFSKKLIVYVDQKFDLTIIVFYEVKERCPYVSGKKCIHKSFENPSTTLGTNNKRIEAFRKTRNEIKSWLEREFIDRSSNET